MKPLRAHNFGTYFASTQTPNRLPLFRQEKLALLLIDVLLGYRDSGKYQLHEFVIMPDHLHVILTPAESLEKALQFIKGGFSFQAKKILPKNQEIWQKSFTDHRIRDGEDYIKHKDYLWQNPVRAGLCRIATEYPYSSATCKFVLDPVPQRLKPGDSDV